MQEDHVQDFKNGEVILDYTCGPDVITRILIREMQDKTEWDKKDVMMESEVERISFGDWRRDPECRYTGRFYTLPLQIVEFQKLIQLKGSHFFFQMLDVASHCPWWCCWREDWALVHRPQGTVSSCSTAVAPLVHILMLRGFLELDPRWVLNAWKLNHCPFQSQSNQLLTSSSDISQQLRYTPHPHLRWVPFGGPFFPSDTILVQSGKVSDIRAPREEEVNISFLKHWGFF